MLTQSIMNNRIKILQHDALDLIGASEDWETIKEASQILDYCEGEVVDEVIEQMETRINQLLTREL